MAEVSLLRPPEGRPGSGGSRRVPEPRPAPLGAAAVVPADPGLASAAFGARLESDVFAATTADASSPGQEPRYGVRPSRLSKGRLPFQEALSPPQRRSSSPAEDPFDDRDWNRVWQMRHLPPEDQARAGMPRPPPAARPPAGPPSPRRASAAARRRTMPRGSVKGSRSPRSSVSQTGPDRAADDLREALASMQNMETGGEAVTDDLRAMLVGKLQKRLAQPPPKTTLKSIPEPEPSFRFMGYPELQFGSAVRARHEASRGTTKRRNAVLLRKRHRDKLEKDLDQKALLQSGDTVPPKLPHSPRSLSPKSPGAPIRVTPVHSGSLSALGAQPVLSLLRSSGEEAAGPGSGGGTHCRPGTLVCRIPPPSAGAGLQRGQKRGSGLLLRRGSGANLSRGGSVLQSRGTGLQLTRQPSALTGGGALTSPKSPGTGLDAPRLLSPTHSRPGSPAAHSRPASPAALRRAGSPGSPLARNQSRLGSPASQPSPAAGSRPPATYYSGVWAESELDPEAYVQPLIGKVERVHLGYGIATVRWQDGTTEELPEGELESAVMVEPDKPLCLTPPKEKTVTPRRNMLEQVAASLHARERRREARLRAAREARARDYVKARRAMQGLMALAQPRPALRTECEQCKARHVFKGPPGVAESRVEGAECTAGTFALMLRELHARGGLSRSYPHLSTPLVPLPPLSLEQQQLVARLASRPEPPPSPPPAAESLACVPRWSGWSRGERPGGFLFTPEADAEVETRRSGSPQQRPPSDETVALLRLQPQPSLCSPSRLSPRTPSRAHRQRSGCASQPAPESPPPSPGPAPEFSAPVCAVSAAAAALAALRRIRTRRAAARAALAAAAAKAAAAAAAVCAASAPDEPEEPEEPEPSQPTADVDSCFSAFMPTPATEDHGATEQGGGSSDSPTAATPLSPTAQVEVASAGSSQEWVDEKMRAAQWVVELVGFGSALGEVGVQALCRGCGKITGVCLSPKAPQGRARVSFRDKRGAKECVHSLDGIRGSDGNRLAAQLLRRVALTPPVGALSARGKPGKSPLRKKRTMRLRTRKGVGARQGMLGSKEDAESAIEEEDAKTDPGAEQDSGEANGAAEEGGEGKDSAVEGDGKGNAQPHGQARSHPLDASFGLPLGVTGTGRSRCTEPVPFSAAERPGRRPSAHGRGPRPVPAAVKLPLRYPANISELASAAAARGWASGAAATAGAAAVLAAACPRFSVCAAEGAPPVRELPAVRLADTRGRSGLGDVAMQAVGLPARPPFRRFTRPPPPCSSPPQSAHRAPRADEAVRAGSAVVLPPAAARPTYATALPPKGPNRHCVAPRPQTVGSVAAAEMGPAAGRLHSGGVQRPGTQQHSAAAAQGRRPRAPPPRPGEGSWYSRPYAAGGLG
eukprot:TRINITY_DN29405_c0_g1_i2.p1 TRINITY_DN29405_c0_g1~~TRINITY_DN29405_c0_g1_i2.p1  ORF type:complete len:1409 (+),score=350.89 TRINITY_DN29405_c0_g1_i2:81-4229(+)